MKRSLILGLTLATLSLGGRSVGAVAPPDGLSIPDLTARDGLLSHDGSFFLQFYAQNVEVPEPVVTATDGTEQEGRLTLLSEADVDADPASTMLWIPAIPLADGTYDVVFDDERIDVVSGTMQVDSAISLEVVVPQMEMDFTYRSAIGEDSGGTVCCPEYRCFDASCEDCMPIYEFLVGAGRVHLPIDRPHSIVIRGELGQGTDTMRRLLTQTSLATAFGDLDVDEPLCATFEVLDASLAVLQTEERCGQLGEAAADQERVSKTDGLSYCDETCIAEVSTVEPDVEADCDSSVIGVDEDEDKDNGLLQPKQDSGCSTADGVVNPALLGVLLFVGRRRRLVSTRFA